MAATGDLTCLTFFPPADTCGLPGNAQMCSCLPGLAAQAGARTAMTSRMRKSRLKTLIAAWRTWLTSGFFLFPSPPFFPPLKNGCVVSFCPPFQTLRGGNPAHRARRRSFVRIISTSVIVCASESKVTKVPFPPTLLYRRRRGQYGGV